jgi:hypothetical protein
MILLFALMDDNKGILLLGFAQMAIQLPVSHRREVPS